MPSRAMMPTAETGERLPAFKPFAMASAIRNRETPALAPSAMPTGATTATPAAAPGPTAAITPEATNASTGNKCLLCEAGMMRRAIAASAPLASASANSSVTPSKVRNSEAGKPAATASALIPAAPAPTSHASANASTPTLMRVVHDSTITTNNAASDQPAAVMRGRIQRVTCSVLCVP